jgi:hypothetical protein
MNRDGDDLNIRYVTDIDSIRQQHLMEKAPRFNPDTRTYFKCSIYSPSNRLYTVNEEVNSTMSGGEPDTFSYSGGLRQGLRNQMARTSGHSIPFPDKIIEEDYRVKIEEEEAENEEEDPGNVSETGSVDCGNGAEVPTNLTSPRMIV